jgi:DUF4097 and DUF4098 domain-containing protein YvlB
MRAIYSALGATIAFLSLAGCDDMNFDIGDRYKEDFHYNFALQPGGKLDLENFNGSVDIAGWDKNEVEVNGTKYARSKDLLDSIKIETSNSPDAVRFKTSHPVGHGNMGAKYTIRVPRKVVLNDIRSSNGAIHVEDIDGTSRLHTSNGGVRLSRVKGDIDIETSNGTIELEGVNGNATLRTSNGKIKGDIKGGALEANTSNGGITLALADGSGNGPVRMHSSNGSIDLTLDNAREVHATTSNSSITVHLPSSANGRVRAHTSNSSIDTDFDVLVKGGVHTKHELEGTLGSGGPLIDLSTSNGGIHLVKN